MSSAPLSYKELARYYDLIYTFKDYQKEAEKVQTIIEKFKKSEGHELLDVACGTAKHLLFLQDSYQCTGVDMSGEMLEIAKRKLPHLEFRKENMIHMRLEKQFDIITCLFSSIGYVKTWKNLQKTWETFALHLKKGGVAVVEPWFTREQYKIGLPCMTTYEDENIKIARLNVANAEGNISVMDMHYLVAEKDQEVKYFQDHHEIGMFDIDQTLEIMRRAGFNAEFSPDGLMRDRGIYIGVKK